MHFFNPISRGIKRYERRKWMRTQSVVMVAALAASSAFAQSNIGNTRHLSLTEAAKNAASYRSPEQAIAMYIWSDKYVYHAGDSMTVRWTVKTNNDRYPYTVVAYRQNNQTGKKFYFPGGTEDVVDKNGSTLAQGFQPAQLQDVSKGTLIGSGGVFPTVSIPNELG